MRQSLKLKVPEKIRRRYQRLHEKYEETGQMPAYGETSKDTFCKLSEASPATLSQVVAYEFGAAKAQLFAYHVEPTPEVAKEIAQRLFVVDVAESLRAGRQG